MKNITQINQCLPFLAQATGKTMAELYAMTPADLMFLCGEHGAKLFATIGEMRSVEALTFAEAVAMGPLTEMLSMVKLKAA